jgi:hypothetical protein
LLGSGPISTLSLRNIWQLLLQMLLLPPQRARQQIQEQRPQNLRQ